MSLSSMTWTQVTIHEMVLAWLQAERGQVASVPTGIIAGNWATLLDHPDTNNAHENRMRLRLLYAIRNIFVIEIPPDTEWFLVDKLTDAELDELHVINHPDWTSANDNNELRQVSARKNLQLNLEPSFWQKPVLWGHDRAGPFTILEGNHRLTAYAGSGRNDLEIGVFVGLSPIACSLHAPDQAGRLIRDLLGCP